MIIPAAMIGAAWQALVDGGVMSPQEGTEAVEAALVAALLVAEKDNLVLCALPGGVHEGACPTCGCKPHPLSTQEKGP